MTDIILFTGFLGAGKTTLLNRLLNDDSNPDKTVGVIVNEFSQTGVDGQVIQTPAGMDLVELNNGSIFCACIKDHFVDALIELAGRKLDLLFIEASGLADPANFTTILDGIKKQTKDVYRYLGGICLIDALYFPKLFNLLPALKRQLLYSKIVLINKVDLANQEQLSKCRELILQTNSEAVIYETTYAQVFFEQLYEGLLPQGEKESQGEEPASPGKAETEAALGGMDGESTGPKVNLPPALESTNTPETRLKTLTVRPTKAIPLAELQEFLKNLAPDTYRMKGFVSTLEGPCYVSCVGEEIEIQKVNQMPEQASLVVISSVGIKIISRTSQEAKKYWGEDVQIKMD